MRVFLKSSVPQFLNPQFLSSSNPQFLKPLCFVGCWSIVENFLKKNRRKWWKVGKNALILQVEKMI